MLEQQVGAGDISRKETPESQVPASAEPRDITVLDPLAPTNGNAAVAATPVASQPGPVPPPPPARPAAPRRGESPWMESLRFLGSLKFFIPTIVMIALGVALGTLVDPQTFPKWLEQHPNYAGISRAFGLPDVYHSFWFMSLLTAFFINLSICSWLRWNRIVYAFSTVFGKLKVAPGMPGNLQRRPIGTVTPEQVQAAFKRLGYRSIVSPKAGGLRVYGEKGQLGLLGPWVTHIGILLTLTGGFLGGLLGFTSYVEGIDGESFQWPMVVHNMSFRPRIWPNFDKNWRVKVNTFWIEFDEKRQPKQFYSDLSVIKDSKEVHREKIWVNKPLSLDGMLWYQANWGIGGLDAFINGRTETIKSINWPKGGFLARWPSNGPLRYVFYFTDARGPYFIFDNKGKPVREVPKGLMVKIGQDTIMIRRTILKTGLQIGYDPGYPLVAIGFIILGMGVMLAWFSHSQIWVHLPKDSPGWAAGKTRKARFALEKDMKKLIKELSVPAPVAVPPVPML
jgi:cytochrome c biogenesis protein